MLGEADLERIVQGVTAVRGLERLRGRLTELLGG